MAELAIERTTIDGLLVLRLPVHGDSRGWFKENWQREKMLALGLPDFGPVQQNMSFNAKAGATRGIHAEPWDKFVALATGRVFCAWVDLRPGPGFGKTFTIEMGPDTAVFVPRGVANSYQALEDGTTYSYLVNAHWSPEARAKYTYVNLFDPELGIEWPIPESEAEVSDADRQHPMLADVTPMAPKKRYILGAGGQLGTALRELLPDAVAVDVDQLDLTDPAAIANFDFSDAQTVINAAAYTNVDGAETEEGRRLAWAINATAVAALAAAARKHRFTLVHISTDYVFDGAEEIHTENEPMAPLGVYGQSKAAGDLAAMSAPHHIILRTSWVVGSGKNFVRTMASLADRDIAPKVINDATGRLTFTEDLAAAIVHLLREGEHGVFNCSNSGPIQTWYDVAARVFELRGRSRENVTPVSTEEYNGDKAGIAPRPMNSAFDLSRLEATGFAIPSADERLVAYVEGLA